MRTLSLILMGLVFVATLLLVAAYSPRDPYPDCNSQRVEDLFMEHCAR